MPPLRDRWIGPDEQELVLRVRDGDPAAFEAVFHRYFAAVLRFAASFGVAAETAEDLAQDVFAWIWTHQREWAPRGDILSYLLAAVRNRALDVVRTDRRRTEVTARYAEPGVSPAMSVGAMPADAQVEDAERNQLVWRTILALPEQRRTVLLLRWRHGLEWEEIARIMETTVAAARMNHSRAMHLLRERLPEALA